MISLMLIMMMVQFRFQMTLLYNLKPSECFVLLVLVEQLDLN